MKDVEKYWENNRQTAAQMWTLVTIILRFLVGDLIPEDDHYKCFCILLKISRV